mmetsp:Transcript_4960/g.7160  ORF Transcript_4960/g.7160 Transcript_4960/m.7160 type:complete len:256 (-) Transcript_4960:618-1385(-)
MSSADADADADSDVDSIDFPCVDGHAHNHLFVLLYHHAIHLHEYMKNYDLLFLYYHLFCSSYPFFYSRRYHPVLFCSLFFSFHLRGHGTCHERLNHQLKIHLVFLLLDCVYIFCNLSDALTKMISCSGDSFCHAFYYVVKMDFHSIPVPFHDYSLGRYVILVEVVVVVEEEGGEVGVVEEEVVVESSLQVPVPVLSIFEQVPIHVPLKHTMHHQWLRFLWMCCTHCLWILLNHYFGWNHLGPLRHCYYHYYYHLL